MRRILKAAVGVGLATAALIGCDADPDADDDSSAPNGNGAFTPDEGDFSVIFPGGVNPDHRTSDTSTLSGPVRIDFYTATLDTRHYTVARDVFENAPAGGLELSMNRVMDADDSIVSSEPIESQDHPGMRFVRKTAFDDVAGTTLHERYVIDQAVALELIVADDGEIGFDDTEIAEFFDSFKLLAKDH